MSLRYGESFRAAPFIFNCIDVLRTRDRIKIAGDKEHARWIAHRNIVRRRAEMEMSRYQLGRDLCAPQFASHKSGSRILPNRVLDVYDRGHQRDKAQIGLDHCQQGADPTAVTCSENSKFAATSFAQRSDQLPDFDHALTQTFSVSNQVGRDCELAVPITARNSRIVIRQMNEARVPAELVESRSPATITDVRGRHQRVEHEYCRRSASLRAPKEIGLRDIVPLKFCLNWRAPRHACCT